MLTGCAQRRTCSVAIYLRSHNRTGQAWVVAMVTAAPARSRTRGYSRSPIDKLNTLRTWSGL
jgi:hypothetical protein